MTQIVSRLDVTRIFCEVDDFCQMFERHWEEQPQLPSIPSERDITASFQFGLDGIVQINNPEVDSTQGLVELSQTPIEPSDRVATDCGSSYGSSFVVAGIRGVPENPNSLLRGTTVWEDLRPLKIGELRDTNEGELESIAPGNFHRTPLVEDTSWQTSDGGEIQLVATTSHPVAVGISTHCR